MSPPFIRASCFIVKTHRCSCFRQLHFLPLCVFVPLQFSLPHPGVTCLTTAPSRVYLLLNSPSLSASSSLCLSVKRSSSLLNSPHVFLDFVWVFFACFADFYRRLTCWIVCLCGLTVTFCYRLFGTQNCPFLTVGFL